MKENDSKSVDSPVRETLVTANRAASFQSLLRAPLQDPAKAICTVCSGNEDSDIWPGDMVAIDFTVDRFDTDAVFVIDLDGAPAFRTVQRIPKEGRGVRIHFRQDGKMEELSDEMLSRVHVVGRVNEVFHSDRNSRARRVAV